MKKEVIFYVAGSALLAYLFLGKSKPKIVNTDKRVQPDAPNVKGLGFEKESLEIITQEFGGEIARWVERIYRLETRNFDSGQYKKTGSPGMEAFGASFPFGWTTISRELWGGSIADRPVGRVIMNENVTGKQKEFLVFPSVLSGMRAVATHIKKKGGPGWWFSTQPELQQKYVSDLEKFRTKYT